MKAKDNIAAMQELDSDEEVCVLWWRKAHIDDTIPTREWGNIVEAFESINDPAESVYREIRDLVGDIMG